MRLERFCFSFTFLVLPLLEEWMCGSGKHFFFKWALGKALILSTSRHSVLNTDRIIFNDQIDSNAFIADSCARYWFYFLYGKKSITKRIMLNYSASLPYHPWFEWFPHRAHYLDITNIFPTCDISIFFFSISFHDENSFNENLFLRDMTVYIFQELSPEFAHITLCWKAKLKSKADKQR